MLRGPSDTGKFVDGRAGEAREIDGLRLDVQSAGVELGQVEQIVGELRQPTDLARHGVEELASCRLVEVFVLQQLEEAAEREERCPQLVRGVGDELAPRMIQTREPDAHPVERPRQLAELIGAAIRNRLVEAAARDPICCPLEPANAAREQARGGVADQQG